MMINHVPLRVERDLHPIAYFRNIIRSIKQVLQRVRVVLLKKDLIKGKRKAYCTKKIFKIRDEE